MLSLKNGNKMEFKVNRRIKGFTVKEFARNGVAYTTEMSANEFIDLLEKNGYFNLVLEAEEFIENYL